MRSSSVKKIGICPSIESIDGEHTPINSHVQSQLLAPLTSQHTQRIDSVAMAVYAATRHRGVTSWPSRNWTLRLKLPLRKPNRCCDVARRSGPGRGTVFRLADVSASGGWRLAAKSMAFRVLLQPS